MDNTSQTTKITSDKDAKADGKTFVELWIAKIDDARDYMKDWEADARGAVKIYEADEEADSEFNIFFSNVETIIPALFNSVPVPDVRRRWEEDDEIARCGAEISERGIVYSLDSYSFSTMMEDIVRDGQLTGRGQARVRYEPTLVNQKNADGTEAVDSSGEALQAVQGEMLYGEIVPWDRWGHGRCRTWEQNTFVFFDHDLTKDEVSKLMGVTDNVIADDSKDDKNRDQLSKRELFKTLAFTSETSEPTKRGSKKDEDPLKGIYGTLPVIEVWDKTARTVFFITKKETKQVLASFKDPLGLKNFFPVPRSLQVVRRASGTKPIVPYKVYKKLVKELDRISKRISKLTESLKVRGLVSASMAKDIDSLGDLKDGQYTSGKDQGAFAKGAVSALADLIHHFPLDPIVQALTQLYTQREQCKQAIYEITGISDILRGATNPHETLGAQQIKANWGSQRIQRAQNEVGRFAADFFAIKAEIFCRKFDWQTIKDVTRITFDPDEDVMGQAQPGVTAIGANGGPPMDDPGMQNDPNSPDPEQQAAQAQIQAHLAYAEAVKQKELAVKKLLQQDFYSYRIDIESDSTIKADLARNADQMNQFVTATGLFWQAVLPIAQAVPKLLPSFTELYGVMAGNFKLGKRGNDILDRMLKVSEEAAQNGGVNTGGPSPEEVQMQQNQQQHEVKQQSAEAQQQQEQNAHDAAMQSSSQAHEAQQTDVGQGHEKMITAMTQIHDNAQRGHDQIKAQNDSGLARQKTQQAIIKGRADIQKSVIGQRTAQVKAGAEKMRAVSQFSTALANAKTAAHKATEAKAKAKSQPPKGGSSVN